MMRRRKLANRLGDVREQIESLIDGTVTGEVEVFDAALRIEPLLGGMHCFQREYPAFALSVEELEAVNAMQRGWKVRGPQTTAEVMQAARALRHIGL